MRKMELLAPAGNFECLKAAVQSGADAVYFAGRDFGARSYADNFDTAEIAQAAAYCRLRKVKAYVTVNTLVLDRELPELCDYIRDLVQAGIDAVIVQDLGVMRLIRQICPDLPVHVSTQATVHNLAGVQAMERLGAKRVVLARELSADNIRRIAAHTEAELEVFVHGAMCMSYSGQCLMSSVLGGRSGNRGKCAQPCRLPYRGAGGEQFYLSLKDMSLLCHLQELAQMGIASLKIEGRMKGPAYVAAVVEVYRSCLDEDRMPKQSEIERLERIFFRGGLTDAYFCGRTGRGMFAFDKPDNPYQKNGGNTASVPGRTEERRRRRVIASLQLRTGSRPVAELRCDGCTVRTEGAEVLQPAEQKPITKEVLISQFTKTGGTPFDIDVTDITIEGQPFCAAKEINALRREGLGRLTDALQQPVRRVVRPPEELPLQNSRPAVGEPRLRASVLQHEQFQAVKKFPFEKIYVPMHLLLQAPEAYLPERQRIVIVPSAIVQDDSCQKFEADLKALRESGFQSLLIHGIAACRYADWFALYGGFRLNVTNSCTMRELGRLRLQSAVLSPELNLAQIRGIEKTVPAELFAYGRLPLMLTENCILKNIGTACPCGGTGTLTDRKGARFPVVRDGASCRSIVLNAVPLYMADRMDDLRSTGAAALQLSFTTEDPVQCQTVCRAYASGATPARQAYTRLHFYKGVF